MSILSSLYSKAFAALSGSKLSVLVSNKYLFALLILLLTVLVGKIFLFIIEKIVLGFTRRTKTELDDLIIAKARKPLFYILTLAGILLSFSQLGIGGLAATIMNRSVSSLILFVLAIAINRVAGVLVDVLGKKWAEKTVSTLDDELLPLFRKLSTVIIFILALIFILKIWKIDISGLLAGLGIAGIAIGFALQDSLKNIFGGVSLILDNNLKVGDKVKLDTGDFGEILDIGLRSTRIKTADNELIIIPNGNLATTKIHNIALPDLKRRISIKFSLPYGNNLEEAEKQALNAISKVGGLVKEPKPEIIFAEIGDSSISLVCRFWVSHYKNAESAKSLANRLIYESICKKR